MAPNRLEERIEEKQRSQLGVVRHFAETVWAAPRLLPGFTDHGSDHTFRVIMRIEEFLQDASLLSEDEAFVLLAACWLHDICMQDYGQLEERNAGRHIDVPLSADEQRLVRTNHALRIMRVLTQDQPIVLRSVTEDGLTRKSCELPRLGVYRRWVALVASGHSTSGFNQVKDVPNNTGPRGLDTRGPTGPPTFRISLLAALLLVGDECDLDHSRTQAIDNAGIQRLHPVSTMHHLKHRYISQSRIIACPDDVNARHLKILYNWPEDDPGTEANYRRWIEGKILAQINLVQPTISRELGIKFHTWRPFRIEESRASMWVESLPQQVFPFLDAERVRMSLADLEHIHREIGKGLGTTPVHILVEPGRPGELGASGVAKLAISQLLAEPSDNGYQPYRQVEIDAADDPTCTDPPALTQRILGLSNVSALGDVWGGVSESGWWPSQGILEDLGEYIVQAGRVIVLLHHVHHLPTVSKRFLIRALIPAVCRYGRLKLFITTGSMRDLPTTLDDGVKVLEMPMVSREDVLEFLRYYTLEPIEARDRSLGDLQSFTQIHANIIAKSFWVKEVVCQ